MKDTYADHFIRLSKLSRGIRFLPWPLKAAIGRQLGRRISFVLLQKTLIVGNLCTYLGIAEVEARRHFLSLAESTGVAMQMAWQLHDIAPSWLEKYVIVSDSSMLSELRLNGGVLFSHHSYHHNLLLSCFKLWDIKTFPIGNPPEAFSPDQYLYNFTLRLNEATESNLNGGGWLFNNRKRELIKGIDSCIENRNLLVAFCDFNEVKKFNKHYFLLGRQIQPPSGVAEYIEKKYEVPVYFAGFGLHSDGRYRLHLERIDGHNIIPAYLEAFEQYLRLYPYVWQNWDIFLREGPG